MSKNLRTSLLLVFFSFCALLQSTFAQTPNNVKIEYQDLNTIPEKLNVCGDPDEVTVILSIAGTSNVMRDNITCELNLFKGVRFVKLVESKSTAGVKMLDTSNVNKPLFRVPNLATANTEVVAIKITYQISADCGFLDTLAQNNNLTVYDTWKVKYDLGSQKNIEEIEKTAEYRDAFEVPVFSLAVLDKFNTPYKAGDCFDRNVQLTNSGLEGSVAVINYSVTYGPGLDYRGILVNNLDVPFQKTALPNGDTLLTVRITGNYFKFNKIGSGPSNGNPIFEPDENLSVKERICVVNCNKPTYSTHTVSWGCFGKECDVKSINSLIPVGVGTPNPVFANTGSVPNQGIGYCQEGISTVTYKNQGTESDPGFGTMYDVITGVGIGGKFETKILGYKVNSLTIAGKNIPLTNNSLIDLGKNTIFKTDPDGPGGLEDLDKDGYFDDLKIGSSYEMVFKYDFLCGENQDTFFCTNRRDVAVSAVSSYRNACDERIDKINENFLNVSNNNNGFEDVSDPDAFIAKNDTFFVHHTEERSLFFFEKNCDGKEELYARVYLPKGVTPVIAQTALFKNGSTTPLVMKSNKISNDTLYLKFDVTDPFLGGKYDLQMAFVANAGASPGFTKFPFEFGFYCPTCDCKVVWYCNNIQGPKLHLADACVTGICPKGVRTTAFDIKRRTFGYTDATFKTKFDPAKANQKVAISCDSVEIRVNAEVGDAAITDGLGVGINYSGVIEKDVPSTNLGEILKFGKGKLIINGTTTCDIDGSKAKFIPSQDKKLRIDLSDCLKSKNITLNKCDKIQFIGSFSIDPDGPYSVQFKYIPKLRGFMYSTDGTTESSCDDFGDNFIVSKNKTLFDFPSSANFPKGCATAEMDYKLVTVNNGFKDYFGKEYRQAVRPDSIHIKFDPAMLTAFDKLDVSYSIPGHPIFGSNQIPLGTLKNAINGQFAVDFDTVAYRIPALNNVSYYSFLFRITAVPNCRALTGSAKGDNRFDFDATLKYVDRFYAKEIGDGSCAPDSTSFKDNDVFYTEPPILAYNMVSNPNFDLVGDTAIWTVKLCNIATNADMGSTFVGIENPNDKLDIVAMDLIDGTKFTPLAVKKYGTNDKNAFALTKGLKASDGFNPIGEVCANVRIKALVKSCGSFQIQSMAGWNCTPPTDPTWNPTKHTPCEDLEQTLRVVAQEPMVDAEMNEGFNQNPDLCDTVFLDLRVRNTGKANAFDVKTQIWIPAFGATLVPGSIEMAYPPSAPFKKIPDPIKGATSTKGILYTYENFKGLNAFLDNGGLPAFNVVNPKDSNEFVIRYRVVTDCEFKSGSLSFFTVQGKKGCGEPTNLETGESKPIKIKGAQLLNTQRIFDIDITDNTLIVPTLISTIELEVKNTTNFPSDTTDKMTITLPPGILYEPGTTEGVKPAGYNPGEPTIKLVSGQQTLTWPIAVGLKKDETAIITFFTTTPDFDCDNVPIFEASIATIVQRSIVCKSNPSGKACILDVITSSGGQDFIELPVSTEGALGIAFRKVTSECDGNGNEKVSIIGDLTNLDSIPFPDFPIEITYFYDENTNGVLDSLEDVVKQFTANGPLNIGEKKEVKHEITVEGARICQLRVQVNAEGTNCGLQSFPVPAPQLQIGKDKDFCAFPGDDISTTIGEDKCKGLNYTYTWLAIDDKNAGFLQASTGLNPTVKFKWVADLPDSIGFYVIVDRGTGCESTKDTVYIFRSLKDVPKAGVSILNDKLCAGATTTLTASGGTKYEWTDTNGLAIGSTTSIQIAPKAPTRYLVKVSNDSGCKDTTSILVTPIPAPNVTASEDITICFGTMKQISATTTGGTNNYSFNWTPALGLNNPIISNPVAKPAETTVYTVTAIDANGCKGTDEVRVKVDTCVACMPPILDLTQIHKAKCGQSNGSISVYPWGGHFDKFIYRWSPNIGTQVGFGEGRTNLPAGVYTLELFLKSDTTCNNSFKIAVPNSGDFSEAKVILGNISNPSCGSTSNGFVNYAVIYPNDFLFPADTVITDGTNVYKNGQLPVGQFFINIYNKNKCLTTSVPFTIANTNGEPINLISKIVDQCDSSNVKGSIDLTVTGGTSPFTFNWADLTSNEPEDRTGLIAGTFNVTVTDAKGCSASNTSVVKSCSKNNVGGGGTNTGKLDVALKATTNVKCFGDANGTVDVVLSGDSTTNAKFKIINTQGVVAENGKLVAGSYLYIVYNSAGIAKDTATFVITQPDKLEATATATEVCKNVLGTITLNVKGGVTPYTYDWLDLTTGAEPKDRTNLTKGSYSVQITDAQNCVTNLGDILVKDCDDNTTGGSGTVTATLKSTAAAKCNGTATGAVDVTLVGDPTLIATAKIKIYNSTNVEVENGKLKAGSYSYVVYDIAGKAKDTVSFTITEPASLVAKSVATEVCKSVLGSIKLNVTGGIAPYTYKWADLTTANQPSERTNLAKGKYTVQVVDANGCTVDLTDIDVKECSDNGGGGGNVSCALNAFAGKDILTTFIPKCDDLAYVCVPLTADSLTLKLDGSPLSINLCKGSYYNVGKIAGTVLSIKDWKVGTKSYNTNVKSLSELADTMFKWDAAGKWYYDLVTKRISGGDKNQTYSTLNITDGTSNMPVAHTLFYNKDIDGTLIKLNKGDYTLIATNPKGCADTLKIAVKCDVKTPKPDTVFVTVFKGETKVGCLDITELAGAPVTTSEGCMSLVLATTTTTPTYCVSFTGVNYGTDTLCYTTCDNYGICDVTYVVLNVIKPFKDITDTIGCEEKTLCIHPKDYGITGNVTIENTCFGNKDASITYKVDSGLGCITYKGLKQGTDTLCLEVCDAKGKCGNFKIFVTVKDCNNGGGGNNGKKDVVYRHTIFTGELYEYCTDTAAIKVISPVSLVKTDSTKLGIVEFSVDSKTKCINYLSGTKTGVDSVCYKVCNAAGKCVTYKLVITVLPLIEIPLARNDYDTTYVGGSITIDEMKNDVIPGKLMSMKLLSQPKLGLVTMSDMMKVQYRSTSVECNTIDTFNYKICNQDGCDSAVISIYIRCAKVKIYNGFSPNDDGSNDSFTIEGIEEFPNSEVRIFNRWGNEVMFTKGYKNNWKGTWNNDNLPDGTYYYLLDLNDEERSMFSGYLQIRR